MRWRAVMRGGRNSCQERELDQGRRTKRLVVVVVIMMALSGGVYMLLGANYYQHTPLPLVSQLRPKATKAIDEKPRQEELSKPNDTSDNLMINHTSHPHTTTTTLPISTKPPPGHPIAPHSPSVTSVNSTLPHTSKEQEKKENEEEELELGYSHLPFPSHTLESTPSEPPSRIFEENPPSANHQDQNLKKILFWNDDYYSKHFGFGFGREPFLVAGCAVNTCTTTGDRERYPLQDLDAVIWHFRSDDRSLPELRSPKTRYIMWLMESPAYLYGDLRDYKDVFNWTFTYRLDSDFLLRYNQVFRRRQPLPPNPNRNYAAGKTKLAAWFVSHCSTESGRITMTRSLQKKIPVEVFGACGPLQCPRHLTHECYAMLNTTYKFYLAFENSLCRDYVTEKFFNVLRLDVVPVVFGLANYTLHAPPHSYINALDFPSVSALADYLIYLHHNDTAYNEYFRWKRYHQMFSYWALSSQQYCKLCERLHTDTTTKTYDMHKWYVEDAHCKDKSSPDIYDFINAAPPSLTHVNELRLWFWWSVVSYSLFMLLVAV